MDRRTFLSIPVMASLNACNTSVGDPLLTEYIGQGINITECGPAVGATAVWWATGKQVTRQEARVFSPQGVNSLGWWSLQTIKEFIQHKGVRVARRGIAAPQGMGVYYVDNSHFVVAVGGLIVGDPMSGVYQTTWDALSPRVSGGYYLEVSR